MSAVMTMPSVEQSQTDGKKQKILIVGAILVVMADVRLRPVTVEGAVAPELAGEAVDVEVADIVAEVHRVIEDAEGAVLERVFDAAEGRVPFDGVARLRRLGLRSGAGGEGCEKDE